MNRGALVIRLAPAAALNVAGTHSQAALSVSWTLHDWNPVVQPNESVVLRATLFNDPFSSETLRVDRLLGRVAEDIEGAYTQTESLAALAAQLQGMALAPGEPQVRRGTCQRPAQADHFRVRRRSSAGEFQASLNRRDLTWVFRRAVGRR